MNKILIVGRSGCGKDTVAQYYVNKYHLRQLISTTTRPPRFEGENTHIFVTPEESKEMTDRVAETLINGYEYFATRGQFEQSDIYVIDPNGVDSLIKSCPNDVMALIYIRADVNTRAQHAENRGDNKERERKIFESRIASEDGQFTEFELALRNNVAFSHRFPNIKHVYVVDNNSTMNCLYEKADYVLSDIKGWTERPLSIEFI